MLFACKLRAYKRTDGLDIGDENTSCKKKKNNESFCVVERETNYDTVPQLYTGHVQRAAGPLIYLGEWGGWYR